MHEEDIVYDLMRERDKLRAEVEQLKKALFQAQEAAKGLAIELERLRTGLGKKRGGE